MRTRLSHTTRASCPNSGSCRGAAGRVSPGSPIGVPPPFRACPPMLAAPPVRRAGLARVRRGPNGHLLRMSEQESVVDAWGIQQDWVDADEHAQRVDDATVARLREVIGTPPADLEERAPIVTRPGRRLGLGRVEVTCEDGSTRTVEDRLPDDFPLGYHRVRVGGHDRLLVVSPGRCRRPEQQTWGWTVQLY